MMNILIAGYGDIGKKVGEKLLRAGHRVYGLKRNATSITGATIPISADLSQPLARGVLPAGLDQILYILSADGFNEQAYQQAYVDGVRYLTQALGENLNSLQRFLFVSSTSVYSQNTGEWVDEESPTQPGAFNGQIMLDAEEQVMDLPNSMVVRFSGIYGEGRNRMLQQVNSGMIAASHPVIYSNRIHSDDCASVLYHMLQLRNPGHRLFLASDNQPAALHDIQQWLADQLGVPQIKRRYQVPARRAGSKRVRNHRLLDSGYDFIYPDFKTGYRELLASAADVSQPEAGSS